MIDIRDEPARLWHLCRFTFETKIIVRVSTVNLIYIYIYTNRRFTPNFRSNTWKSFEVTDLPVKKNMYIFSYFYRFYVQSRHKFLLIQVFHKWVIRAYSFNSILFDKFTSKSKKKLFFALFSWVSYDFLHKSGLCGWGPYSWGLLSMQLVFFPTTKYFLCDGTCNSKLLNVNSFLQK